MFRVTEHCALLSPFAVAEPAANSKSAGTSRTRRTGLDSGEEGSDGEPTSTIRIDVWAVRTEPVVDVETFAPLAVAIKVKEAVMPLAVTASSFASLRTIGRSATLSVSSDAAPAA